MTIESTVCECGHSRRGAHVDGEECWAQNCLCPKFTPAPIHLDPIDCASCGCRIGYTSDPNDALIVCARCIDFSALAQAVSAAGKESGRRFAAGLLSPHEARTLEGLA
ncbi:hypothetical protein [Mycolicibacterium sphagni]|uniref:hypothetical protein n=1 Tax=Mycolicibacterium sphagni TaxID=1786 RepID=UPI0021F2890C|nr:hypothetical protein [Mycolicibacterium sphagni]MCV7174751.1 hypothetical protein [Mycolicibacterium sphagni]